MNREEVQKEVVELKSTYHNMVVEIATGVGKTKIAIDIISELSKKVFEEEDSEVQVLILLAETTHKENWKNEFKKWGISTDKVRFECYQSMRKCVVDMYDLIILDEVHRVDTSLRLDILKSIKTNNTLFLSATISDSLFDILNKNYSNLYRYTFTLKDAIDNKILPEPEIVLIPLRLNNKIINQECEFKRGKGTQKVRTEEKLKWTYILDKKKYPNLWLKYNTTEYGKYKYLDDKFEAIKKKLKSNPSNTMLSTIMAKAGLDRKKYIASLKTKYAKIIVKELEDNNKRFICFCIDINQSEELNKKNSINSTIDNADKLITKFNNKDINSLFAVKMLIEGTNLADIDAGVIVQLNSKERIFIQQIGRVFRSKSPVQYILYYKNTKDEEYVKEVLKGIPDKYIKTDNRFY